MSKFVVGTLLLIFMSLMMITGLHIAHTMRNLDGLQAAVFATRPVLAMEGCVSTTVRNYLLDNVDQFGMQRTAVRFEGDNTSTRTNYGGRVEMEVKYADGSAFLALVGGQLRRKIVTVSERPPSPGAAVACP